MTGAIAGGKKNREGGALIGAGIETIRTLYVNDLDEGPYISNTLRVDPTTTQLEALVEIYRMMRPGEPPTVEAASALFDTLFFDSERYDLSAVGRVKMNMRLELDAPDTQRTLRKEDMLAVVKALIRAGKWLDATDDQGHLYSQYQRQE